MKLCTDILCQELSRKMKVEVSGKHIDTLSLNPPVFWYEDMKYQDGMIYVGRAGELPEPVEAVSCLIVCVGGKFPAFWRAKRCCVFSVPLESDLFRVFNILQTTFSKYESWKEHLEQIVHTTADLEEMLRITAPLFGNSLGACNKHLEVIAIASPDGSTTPVTGQPLSEDRVAMFADSHAQNISMRELFTFTMDGSKTYCLNIFTQDTYQGLLTMVDDGEPITAGKLALLKFFFQYIQEATRQRIKKGNSSTVTLKTVFRELVNCLPVSVSRIAKALSGEHQEKQEWTCLVAKPAKMMEHIPTEYLCSQVERMLPKSVALYQEPYVIMFVPVNDASVGVQAVGDRIEEVVLKLFGYAGVSNAFWDLTEARFYYRQAVIAMETASEFSEHPTLCHFQEYALTFALRSSTGELSPKYILPKGLLLLRQEDAREQDYSRWNTLKIYLNNEMNATQTARDLYIHRTTLQNRLKNIETLVDLSTPENRMYIRYGIYLMELYDTLDT